MSVTFDLDPTGKILERHGMNEGGIVQKVVDSEVLRYNDPYMPFLTGTLRKSGNLATKLGSGEVQYNTPYARYLYYGKLMVGRMPKKLTNINLKFHGGGLCGAKHFERMKIDHKADILRAAQEAIK